MKKSFCSSIGALTFALLNLTPCLASANNCYSLENNTNFPQTWHFQYNVPISAGQPVQLNMIPHGRYPGGNGWCWNGTGGDHATVTVDPGKYVTSWRGPFVMGDGSGFSPPGRYSLNAPFIPPPPPVPDGSLIRSPPQPEVYFVQGHQRHHIPNACTLQAHWSWSQVRLVSQNILNSVPLGSNYPNAPGCH